MLPLAPAPLMSARPSLAGIAPAPPTSLSQQMIVNQHKRPRLETNSAPQALHMSAETMASIAAANQVKSGRQKSQVQVDRRRERNRILARRTRLRKKFFFESLQKDVMELQRENIALKEIVRTSIEPTLSKSILDECTAHESLPDSVLEQCGDPSALDAQDFNLMSSIRQSQQSFIITDPSLQDNPIVYASDDFLQLTGYSRDQVLGRNCRFLQGTDTNPEKVAQIRKAVANGEDVSVTFINYMADGTAFWNKLFIAALRDAQNNIVNFIGVTVKVAGPEPGDPEAALAGQYLANGLDGTHANEDADISGDESVDADAAVMAIEGAVDKAVAAAPTMTKTLS
jgi:PAS domain S-box-containing protein